MAFQKYYFISFGKYGICLTIFLFGTKCILAHKGGAPNSDKICERMIPSHGEHSLLGNMPFNINLDRRFIRGTGKISIEVTSKDPSKYSLKGALFIMKKPNSKLNAYGTFDPASSDKDLKTIACFGKPGTAITHSHPEPKSRLSFQWIAPNDTSAEYELHVTLVRDFYSFWGDYVYPERIRVSADAPAAAGLLSPSIPILLLTVLMLAIRR